MVLAYVSPHERPESGGDATTSSRSRCDMEAATSTVHDLKIM
jgi:hypothetical protein